MCNWFKKLFGGKECCKKCGETAKPVSSTPMNIEANQTSKPESVQSASVDKTQ